MLSYCSPKFQLAYLARKPILNCVHFHPVTIFTVANRFFFLNCDGNVVSWSAVRLCIVLASPGSTVATSVQHLKCVCCELIVALTSSLCNAYTSLLRKGLNMTSDSLTLSCAMSLWNIVEFLYSRTSRVVILKPMAIGQDRRTCQISNFVRCQLCLNDHQLAFTYHYTCTYGAWTCSHFTGAET